jgi:hypothetical protein
MKRVIKEAVKLTFQENQVVWLYLHGQIGWRESMGQVMKKNPTLNPNKTYMPEEETTNHRQPIHTSTTNNSNYSCQYPHK